METFPNILIERYQSTTNKLKKFKRVVFKYSFYFFLKSKFQLKYNLNFNASVSISLRYAEDLLQMFLMYVKNLIKSL